MAKNLLHKQVEVMFSGLNNNSATKTLPEPGTLKENLSRLVGNDKSGSKAIQKSTLSQFATASVEMWHRSVHSFLVSASLTKASPLWSSVAVYYSSHYSIRAFAHLLGYFQLYRKGCIIRLEINGSQYICHILKKGSNDREHKFYWKIVKRNSFFASNPFFTLNDEFQAQSDSGHRNKANYFDHIDGFPQFQILDETYLKQRIGTIAGMEVNDAPIPIVDSYPDINNVQLIAYHRLVIFRNFIDTILRDSNRFWKVHRRPNWCSDYIDFQVVQPRYTTIYSDFR